MKPCFIEALIAIVVVADGVHRCILDIRITSRVSLSIQVDNGWRQVYTLTCKNTCMHIYSSPIIFPPLLTLKFQAPTTIQCVCGRFPLLAAFLFETPSRFTSIESNCRLQIFTADASINSVQWNPNQALTLLAVTFASKYVQI